MKYGDFSSLVQLGTGLSVGSAILQMYGDIGVQPLLRIIARIKSVWDERHQVSEDLCADLARLEGDYEIFRIKLFNEFRFLIIVNTCFFVALAFALVLISYKAEDVLPAELSVLFVAASLLPPPLTLGVLWWNASREIKPIIARAQTLEHQALSL